MDGKVVIVTGSNTGIGYETAKELANRGAKVILACRNLEKAEAAKKQIVAETKNAKVVVKKLDLSSKSSIEEFAKDINSSESRIDVLIHNAGIWGPKEKEMSVDGFELTMAANHLGPFLLTYLLLDLLKRSKSRIVVVSSAIYSQGTLDPEDLNTDKTAYDPLKQYTKTKLANVVFTMELARRLKDTGVTVNCLNPGAVKTAGIDNVTGYIWVLSKVMWFIYKTPKDGAKTSIYLATSPDLENITGKYFSDGKKASNVSSKASNAEFGQKFWSASEKMLGITYPID